MTIRTSNAPEPAIKCKPRNNFGTPDRSRTYNLILRTDLLFQLSYQGILLILADFFTRLRAFVRLAYERAAESFRISTKTSSLRGHSKVA